MERSQGDGLAPAGPAAAELVDPRGGVPLRSSLGEVAGDPEGLGILVPPARVMPADQDPAGPVVAIAVLVAVVARPLAEGRPRASAHMRSASRRWAWGDQVAFPSSSRAKW